MTSILDFAHSLFNFPERYDFFVFIFSVLLALILLDGILSFLFNSISSLTSRR